MPNENPYVGNGNELGGLMIGGEFWTLAQSVL